MQITHNWTTTELNNPAIPVSKDVMNNHVATREATDYTWAAPLYVNGAAASVLTGSIQPTASVAVVGVGTLFTTELKIGDRITVNSQTRAVRTITDDTHLTVDEAFQAGSNDTSPDKLPSSFIVYDAVGNANFMVFDNGAPYFLSGVASSASAVGGEFDTANNLTDGVLFKFKNYEIEKLRINFDGALVQTVLINNPAIGQRNNLNFTTTATGTATNTPLVGVFANMTLQNLTGNWGGEIAGAKYAINFTPGGNYNASTLTGFFSTLAASGSFGSTTVISTMQGIKIGLTAINSGTISNYYGLFMTLSATLTTVTLYEGIHLEAAPAATTKRGIFLKGYGTGNDLVLGTSGQNQIYCEVTTGNLVLNPKITGTGTVKLLGDLTPNANNIILDTVTGSKIGTATNQLLGFYNAPPVVQQTDGAGLTNSVTSGGTTDTIADFTSLTDYATDAQTIRDDIYQLARKVKIIGDALRSYGLLS